MSVYVDTSAFFAVLDGDDEMHPMARREWERELNSGEPLHTSSHVLVETSALLVSSRRDISLVDCVSFEAMRRLGIDQVFCFDSRFAEQGFRVLP